MTENMGMDLYGHVSWSDQCAQFLDSLADRLSTLKMEGRPLSDREILGCSPKQVEELFGLQDFSHRVQTDIVVELAYMRSNAFRQRALESLGMQSENNLDALPNDMKQKLKEVYDRIIERGRDAYKYMNFQPIDNPLLSRYDGCKEEDVLMGEVPTVNIFHGQKPVSRRSTDFMNITAHEIAHHLYNHEATGGINPGIYLFNDEKEYGLEGSPYSKINEDDINPRAFLDLNEKIISTSEFADLLKQSQYTKSDIESLIKTLKHLSAAGQLDSDAVYDYDELGALHDEMGVERAADVHGVRIQMLRDGIWNPFSGHPLTEKDIERFHHLHPNNRIFEYWDKEKSQYFLNHIANISTPTQSSVINLVDCRKQANEFMLNSLQTPNDDNKSKENKYSPVPPSPAAMQHDKSNRIQSLASMNYNILEAETVVHQISRQMKI